MRAAALVIAALLVLTAMTRQVGWDQIALPGIEQEFGPMPEGRQTPNPPYDPHERIVPI